MPSELLERTVVSKKLMILLQGSEATTVLRHLKEIVSVGNTVVFSFSNPEWITALVTRPQSQEDCESPLNPDARNTSFRNPVNCNPRVTKARGSMPLS